MNAGILRTHSNIAITLRANSLNMDAPHSSNRSHPSPSTRSPSLSSSSLQSQDAKSSYLPISVPEAKQAPMSNGLTPTPKKPTITRRITKIFSQSKATSSNQETKAQREKFESSASETESSAGSRSTGHTPSKQNSYKDDQRQRQSSTDSEQRPIVKRDGTARHNGKEHEQPYKRFEVFPDGVHEHTLKSAKRQERLSDMLRDMLGSKRKDAEGQPEDQQLSLMSTWVDQLKNERERVATDKKGGPNATATLVQKYGKCQEIVGRGAFGIVRISHKTDPNDSKNEQLYAVKEFRRRPQESAKKYQKRLTSEFCISSSLRHPNVIHTLDLLQDAKGDYCEVMEFCAGGDLYTLVLAAGKLEVVEADCYFKQLMCGVEYLHEMGVAHRDLKPENLLLTTHGSLKITDFGNGECFRMAWETEAHMTAGLCGSAPYIAPEEYTEKEFDPRAVDVWATGVIYMAMRTGRHLWRVAKKDEDEFYERYLEGRRDEDGYQPIETLHRVRDLSLWFSWLSLTDYKARCRNVIYSILDPNPTRRITASQVLKSEWGREIKVCKAGEEGF